jgi:hypothetical protein
LDKERKHRREACYKMKEREEKIIQINNILEGNRSLNAKTSVRHEQTTRTGEGKFDEKLFETTHMKLIGDVLSKIHCPPSSGKRRSKYKRGNGKKGERTTKNTKIWGKTKVLTMK